MSQRQSIRDELDQKDIADALDTYGVYLSGDKARDFAAAILKRRAFNLGLVPGAVLGNAGLLALGIATFTTPLGVTIISGIAFSAFIGAVGAFATLVEDGPSGFGTYGYANLTSDTLKARIAGNEAADRGIFKSENTVVITLAGLATGVACGNIFGGLALGVAAGVRALGKRFVNSNRKVLGRLGRDLRGMTPSFRRAKTPAQGVALHLPEAASSASAAAPTTVVVTPPRAQAASAHKPAP